MPKGSRVDNPDPRLRVPAAAPEEVERSETRASLLQRDETIQSLESRLHQLESELLGARESLRQKDLELHSLNSLRIPATYPISDSLRAMANGASSTASSSAPTSSTAVSNPAATTNGQLAIASIGYPTLHRVAVAERASTLPPSEQDSTPPSQRRAPRKVCEVELEFTEETHFFTGLTQDISEGGVFVATYRLFPIGTRLDLSFELPDGTRVSTWGRVRWLRDPSASGCRPGMGVEFGALSEPVLRAIVRFCEQRPPLYMEV